jgi:hypothetical protein
MGEYQRSLALYLLTMAKEVRAVASMVVKAAQEWLDEQDGK